MINRYLKPEQQSKWLYGDSVGEGWHPCIEEFLKEAHKVDGFHLEQVKEKFGELRIYWHIRKGGANAALNQEKLERVQESVGRWASNRCEFCGSETKVGKAGTAWIKTMCFKCFSEDRLPYAKTLNLNISLNRDGTIAESL